MFKKHFSSGRAAFTALVLLVSFGFISCQPETPVETPTETPAKENTPVVTPEEKPAEKPAETPDEKPAETLPEGVSLLEKDDPICGDWNGTYGLTLKCSPDFAWATVASATVLADVSGKDASEYITVNEYGTEVNYNKDSSEIYVVYNSKDGKENKLEGVLLFVAKTSAWGNPVAGKWYGVKFQVNEVDLTKALIEGGYNAAESYNTVDTLEKAVELFAYDNTAFYSEGNWTESASGASKVTE